MIHVLSSCRPYVSLATCGDFVFEADTKEGCWITFGDLGGHGNFGFAEAKDAIQHFMEYLSAETTLVEVVSSLAQIPKIKEIGLAVFVGFVRRDLPLLHYCLVGDVRASLIQDGNLQTLESQAGSVGLLPLPAVKEFAVKLQANDKLLLTTDGVRTSFYQQSGLNRVAPQGQTALDDLLGAHARPEDDALMTLVSFCHSSSFYRQNESVKTRSTVLAPAVQTTRNKTEAKVKFRGSNPQPQPQGIKPTRQAAGLVLPVEVVTAARWLIDLQWQANAKSSLRELLEFFDLNSRSRIKWTSVCLERKNSASGGVNVGLSGNWLLFRFNVDEAFKEKLEILSAASHRLIDPKENLFYIGLPVQTARVDELALASLVERLKLGMDATRYAQYEKDRQTEKIMTEQSKLASMGEMVGSIAHQWRQPLNELSLKVQTLQLDHMEGKCDEVLMDEFVGSSIEIVQYMSQTIDDFRNFLRTDTEVSEISARQTLEQVLSLQKAQLETNCIRVAFEGEDFHFNGAASEFKQVLMVLINNAKDALEMHKGEKQIWCELHDRTIQISDNGGGMPAHLIARATEPFFTTKLDGKGTGLGLYIARAIVENKMGGKLSLENVKHGDQLGLAVQLKFPD